MEHCFPQAIQIIDLYHAKEHVAILSKLLFPGNETERITYRNRWWTDLWEGRVTNIVDEAEVLKSRLSLSVQTIKEIDDQIKYLAENKQRMQYSTYRNQGLFVGSGVIEACCKHVVGTRLKQSGMEWTVRGVTLPAHRHILLHD